MRVVKRFAPAIALTLGLVLALAGVSSAATWYVKPDGSGDAATIQDAVWAAAPGDTIFLADGTFSGDGNRDVWVDNESIIICSQSGNPALCIIDCGGSASGYHKALDFRADAPTEAVLAGVTIRGGYGSSTGGVYASNFSAAGGGAVIIVNCVFTENESQWSGGAMMAAGDVNLSLGGCQFTGNTANTGAALGLGVGSTTVATGCTFADNVATASGGAVFLGAAGEPAYAAFVSCIFSGNTAAHYGGAILAEEGDPILMGCRFEGNSAAWSGGALYLMGHLAMHNCVSVRNSAGVLGSSIYSHTVAPITISNCSFVADSLGQAVACFPANALPALDKTVIAFAVGAAAIYCGNPAGALTLTCCNIFGNEYGDWTGCIADQAGINGNISQDPRFCDIPTGDVSVEDCSPCLAANNSCAQDIGAEGQGCLCGEATVPTTWGSIKALYK